MALPAWLIGLIPSAFNAAKEYINRKQKINELKTEAALTIEEKKIESAIRRAESADVADTALDKLSLEDTGWKDDYLLIITTLPMVLLMASPFMDIMFAVTPGDLVETAPGIREAQHTPFLYTEGLIAESVNKGFESLSSAPDYYWYALGAVYVHSLGMRRMFRILMERMTMPIFNKSK